MTRTVLLGDIADIQTGPFGSQLHQEDYVDLGTPIITVEHLGGDRITRQNLPQVSDADKKRLSKYWMQEGDTIFSRVGSVDRASYVHPEEDGWLFSGRCLRVRPDPDKVNPRYLSFVLRSPQFTSYIKSIAVGATMPSINTKLLATAPVILADPEDQDNIAQILNALEQKLELNRTMNETLEQMGQAQFRHYFIDSSSADTLTIDDIAEVIDCLHSKKPERVKEDSDNILLQLNNVKDDGTLDLTDIYHISDEDYQKWTSRIEATENDFVITNVGRSGAVAKIPADVKAALGRNMTAIRLRSETNFPGFLSFLLNSTYMKKQIESRLDHGTILSALNVKTIPKLTLPTGNTELIFDHEKEFKNLRSMIETNARATQTLISLRDTLLPRLINGKISLKG